VRRIQPLLQDIQFSASHGKIWSNHRRKAGKGKITFRIEKINTKIGQNRTFTPRRSVAIIPIRKDGKKFGIFIPDL
jgi:hypothetical protein